MKSRTDRYEYHVEKDKKPLIGGEKRSSGG